MTLFQLHSLCLSFTSTGKVLNTVAHELCHCKEQPCSSTVPPIDLSIGRSPVASWLISRETKNPHGRVFKNWLVHLPKAHRRKRRGLSWQYKGKQDHEDAKRYQGHGEGSSDAFGPSPLSLMQHDRAYRRNIHMLSLTR
jgi:hypothetical protein